MGAVRWSYSGPVFFIVGAIFWGLAYTFHVIASYSLPEAERVGRLKVITAKDLARIGPGDQVLVNGIIDEASAADYQGLVIYEEYRARVDRGKGNMVWWDRVSTHESKPAFQLRQLEGVISVLGGSYELEKRVHAVPLFPTGFGRPRTGDSRYEGFRLGDEVTVLGTVERRGKQRALEAVMVRGGTPEEWVEAHENQAAAFRILAWAFLLIGLCFPIFGYLRRTEAAPPRLWSKAEQEEFRRWQREQRARRGRGENTKGPGGKDT
jgi:hypothetical protein